MSKLPNLPFAVFDEFGQSCEDRVADHFRAAAQAAQPEAVGVPVLNLTLTRQEAEYIAAFVSVEDNEPSDDVVTLMVGNGHSGYGLYAAHPEYPEEGAVFVRALAAAQTPEPMSAPTAEPVAKQPPYAYIYEWDGPFGVHQSTSSARYNGMAPHRSVPVWTTPPSAATPEPSDAERPMKSLNALIADQLRPFLKPGDKVIWREAFRWHDDNGVMPNHYDGMSVTGLADEFGYQFDWDFNMNHAAIVRATKGGKL